MNGKHTPGPWSLHGDTRNLVGAEDGKAMIAHILRIEDHPPAWIRSKTEVKANADLISAAPELAEACKALIALVNGPLPVNGNTVADVHILARAALRKAGLMED